MKEKCEEQRSKYTRNYSGTEDTLIHVPKDNGRKEGGKKIIWAEAALMADARTGRNVWGRQLWPMAKDEQKGLTSANPTLKGRGGSSSYSHDTHQRSTNT